MNVIKVKLQAIEALNQVEDGQSQAIQGNVSVFWVQTLQCGDNLGMPHKVPGNPLSLVH